jgi:hypothetical protein
VPLTFHVKNVKDNSWAKFVASYKEDSVWIVKPGENSNRGNGIEVFRSLTDIQRTIRDKPDPKRTYIIQQYIQNPLLIHNRKFDIRCFAVVTSVNGNRQAYFYRDGYLRTSCREFTLDDVSNRYIHLTNDAV